MNAKTIVIDGIVSYGSFLNRPNRFLVNFIPEGFTKSEKAFLHDPGRMKELLLPNARLILRKPLIQENRKTSWDILAVEHNEQLVVIKSNLPNVVAKEALSLGWIKELSNYNLIKSEVTVGNSRLDFLLENGVKKCFIEVKGVTLVKDKKALFPDAPTERGTRHLQELIDLSLEGYRAIILFICMREDPLIFSPNYETDPKFSHKLKLALDSGVEILVYKVLPRIIENRLNIKFNQKLNVEI
ncbi:MAG: DNA/RNA nuclease SfsA [Candidatus Heimdallarchaeota archaeon]|nr:DNA/RNA nuclease SfsA [Candidatus Heimdallarchaeota archaeon]